MLGLPYRHPKQDLHRHVELHLIVEDSCIEVSELVLVALVSLELWRTAYERGSFDGINQIVDLPRF